MKEITCNKRYRKHTPLKVIGTVTLSLLILVSVTSASPFAYVINNDLPSGINVIDTATNKVTSYVDGDITGPGVTVNPTGTKVFVTNSDKNTVSVINATTNKVTATVSVGRSPYGVAFSPDGTKVFVANSGSNTVSVINATTNKVTATVNVGRNPCGVVVTPDGKKVYITNSGDYNIPSKTVSVIDCATNMVTATVNVGSNPRGVAVTEDGKKVYVANYGYNTPNNTISVIDCATNMVTATVKLGSTPEGYALCPNEVAITPDGKKVYVACSGFFDSCYVPVIDTSTNNVITNIADGAYENVGIAITPDGKKVYVVNRGHTGAGYGVSIINTATNMVSGYVDSGEYMLVPMAFGQFIGPLTSQKPVAEFNASPTSGYIPLKVQFFDKSTNNPTSWKWNFGDGTNSTLQNPVHLYLKVGNFTVNLTAINANGSSSKTAKITVLTKPILPVANFTSNISKGYVPLAVKFTDLSKYATSRKWYFGDGTNSTLQNPIHVYSKVGNFTVNLTVNNANGTNSKLSKITVQPKPVLPVANFTANVTTGYMPLTVKFTDLSKNATSWKWNFGDQTSSTLQSPIHRYSTRGNFTVKLTVSNSAGNNTMTKTNYIKVK